MKVTKRDVLLILALIGILAAALSYFLVFDPYKEKTEALVAENGRLQQQVAALEEKEKNKEFYEKEMERMRQEIADIYQVFPVDVREEDCILMAINQEIISPMDVQSINISLVNDVEFTVDTSQEPVHDYSTGGGDVPDDAAAAANTSDTTGMLRNRQTTFNYTVSYEGLKRSILHIGDQTNRMAIDSLTASFDDATGLLVGTTTLNMYIAPYQEDKPYVQPNFSAVLLGTDNIFGTIVITSEANMPDVEDMGEEVEAETGN